MVLAILEMTFACAIKDGLARLIVQYPAVLQKMIAIALMAAEPALGGINVPAAPAGKDPTAELIIAVMQ